MSSLERLVDSLETGSGELHLDPALGAKARVCIDRMLAFTGGASGAPHAPSLGSA